MLLAAAAITLKSSFTSRNGVSEERKCDSKLNLNTPSYSSHGDSRGKIERSARQCVKSASNAQRKVHWARDSRVKSCGRNWYSVVRDTLALHFEVSGTKGWFVSTTAH